ncbi:Peptidylprolyl_isomerase [Hexamita inflata]|uniref:peptidylprolyl isomerase n=1 Tax=Hexamita inflata TaxID=28002 RepID=A0AA86UAA3_9EUKA|nr:Peptidylprolyl isomerase [Hexamita inflata]
MQKDNLKDVEPVEDGEEFYEEEDGEEYDYAEEQCESDVTASTQSNYPYFDAKSKMFFMGQKIKASERFLEATVPAFVTMQITGLSLSVDNSSTSKHIVSLLYSGVSQVIARLIPNRVETVQVDITIPATAAPQTFRLLLDGENVQDVDVVTMIYSEEPAEEENEYEEMDEKDYNEYILGKQEACTGCETNPTCSGCPNQKSCQKPQNTLKETEIVIKPKPNTKEPKDEKKNDPIDQFFASQSRAKAQEHKMDRSTNKTQIDYKDVINGTGKTAMPNKTIRIKLILRENNEKGKILEEVKDQQVFKFKIGRGDVSEGLERVVLGMREGGDREATGPKKELIGDGEGKAWVKIQCVSVE